MPSEATRLLVIPHTHWDREWYRTHEQFRFRLVRLIDRLLELLETDPSFRHFTLDGQVVVVDDYLEVRPEARERIAKLVEADRLHLGPWYVLPDEWLVSGEALVRNLRLGLRRAEALGGAMRLGYVPDQFGHIGQLPQIFKGFGLEAALLWRGVGADVRQTLFRWEASDGSELLTVFLARGYSNAAYLPTEPELLAERLREEIEWLGKRSSVPTLLLMNGSDHAEPDPRLPRALEAAATELPGVSIEIASLPEFVRRVRDELPSELPHHRGEFRSGLRSPLLSGCASARMPQKRADFENDRLLTRYLEPLGAWLGALGGDVDPGLVDFAWRTALENHPHDSICGCSIDAVHKQMETRFARVAEIAGAELERVFGEIARRVELPAQGFGGATGPQFVVWNPNPAGLSPVEVEVDLDEEVSLRTLRVYSAGGHLLPTRVQRLEASTELLKLSLPVALARSFLARDFPDFLGYWLQDLSWQDASEGFAVQLRMGSLESTGVDLAAKRTRLREAMRASAADTVSLVFVRRARVRLGFVDRLPGYGLRSYRVGRGRGTSPAELISERSPRGGWAIANAHWRVEVDAAGRVALIRRADARRVEDAVRLVSEADRGDEYTFDPVPGSEDVERPDRVRVDLERPTPSDPSVSVRLRARYRVPESVTADRCQRVRRRVWLPVDLRIRLWAGVDRIDLSLEVDNRARDHRLRIQLAAPFQASRLSVESAFEIADRVIATPGRHPEKRDLVDHLSAHPERLATGGDARTARELRP